jgi:MFS family permease
MLRPNPSISPTWSLLAELVLPIYAPTALLAFAQGLLVPILPAYAHNFSQSYGLVGLVLAGEAVGMLLADLPSGALLGRLGQRTSMLAGGGLLLLSVALLVWARNIPQMFGCRLLAGGGLSLYGISRHTYLADSTPTAQRGKAIALLGGLLRLGNFAGPLAGGWIANRCGSAVVFLLFSGVALLAMLVVGVSIPGRGDPQTSQPRRRPLLDRKFLRRLKTQSKQVASAGSGYLLMQVVRIGPQILIPLYAATVIGLNVQQIGIVVGLAGAVDMTLFYPAGIIMDRWGRKYAIVSSLVFLALGTGGVALSTGFSSLLPAALLSGFGNGLGSGAMLTLGADLAPPDFRGEFLGLWRLIGDSGSTCGPLMVGVIADVITLPASTLLISTSGLLATLIFVFLVPETLKFEAHAIQEQEPVNG